LDRSDRRLHARNSRSDGGHTADPVSLKVAKTQRKTPASKR
jgi:hypothetical protein